MRDLVAASGSIVVGVARCGAVRGGMVDRGCFVPREALLAKR